MRVLFATAEMAPLVRVGGLGEVSGGVTKELRRLGVDVDVALPDYHTTPLADEKVIALDVPEWAGPATARHGVLAGFGPVTLIDVPDIARAGAYGDPGGPGYSDNDRRFIRFSAAVAALARLSSPDVLHINDWHTAATLAFVPPDLASVVSIHNLAYQGECDRGWLMVFGDRSDAYDWQGMCNPLRGALALADRVLVVSPNYAKEITRPEMGCGLEGLLSSRGDAVVGIVNGIDTDEWDPANDSAIAAAYSSANLSGKAVCRAALRAQMGLSDKASGPVVGFVSRLVEQKGVDLLVEAADFLPSMDAQLAVIGSGEPQYRDALNELVARHPGRVAFFEGYDLTLSHRVFAGADLYMMPSRFEPCGLAQMQAMRYGTLPVVTGVGGLVDTVLDITANPRKGTGFVTSRVSAAAMVDALHRANAVYSSKSKRTSAQARAMAADWSWTSPAMQYLSLYTDITSS